MVEATQRPNSDSESAVPQKSLHHKTSILEKIALALSAIFSPLIVPTYACAIALWASTLQSIPEKNRLMVCLMIFALTSLVPLAAIIYLIKSGKVSDAAISDRKQRGLPYRITWVCYMLAALYLSLVRAPEWLVFFFVGACVCTIIAKAINLIWKISAHMMTLGGLLGMVLYIAINGLAVVKVLPWICGVVLICGMVGSSRILLGRHTPGQVYTGWTLGLIIIYIFMSL